MSVQALVERFTAVGIRPVLKHAATALGVVSTYAMGVDPDPDAGHPGHGGRRGGAPVRRGQPDQGAAGVRQLPVPQGLLLRRPGGRPEGDPGRLLGVSGSTPRRASPGRDEAMAAWRDQSLSDLRELTAPDESGTVPYPDVVRPRAPEGQPEMRAHLLGALSSGEIEHDVLAARTEVDGVVVAKVVVTGLEVETLSYGGSARSASATPWPGTSTWSGCRPIRAAATRPGSCCRSTPRIGWADRPGTPTTSPRRSSARCTRSTGSHPPPLACEALRPHNWSL